MIPQGSALVWRLAWSQVGNCWLEAIEESKRLKREKGTHKKVRDSNNETASNSHTFMFMPQTQHVTIAFLPSAFGSLTFLCVPFSLLSLLHSSTTSSQQLPTCDHASLHTSAEPCGSSGSLAARSKGGLGRVFERGPGSQSLLGPPCSSSTCKSANSRQR